MEFLKKAGDKFSEATEKADDAIHDSAAYKKMEAVTDDLKDTDAYRKLEAVKEEKMAELKEFENEQKRKIAGMVYEKLDGVFEHGMAVANTKTKEAIKDPYMPDCVFGMMSAVVDAWWPDVKNEAKAMILSAVRTTDELYHGEPPCCKYSPLALMRYWLQPYDRNIWRKIRNPFWWTFVILSIVPKYGIAAMSFTFLFLLIDRGDEFQLQEFILNFKGVQFISLGLASICVGAAQYFFCTTMDPQVCDEWAPREEVFTVLLFVWQVILVWIAFLFQSCSKSKGGDFYHIQNLEGVSEEDLSLEHALVHENLLVANAVADEESTITARRRMRNLLIYDFCVFIACLGATFWLAFHFMNDPSASIHRHDDGWSKDNWKFASGLYWIKVTYGMMSFPFILLKIPGLSTIISHARPTGYNPYGNCVRYVGTEEDGPLPWAPDRPTKEEREAREKEEKVAAKAAAKVGVSNEPIEA